MPAGRPANLWTPARVVYTMGMYRSTVPTVLIVALLVVSAALAGCGNGDTPAPIGSAITPSPGGSASTPVSPGATSPGGTPSPDATVTLSPTASPGGGDGQDGQDVTDRSIKASILARIAQSPVLAGVRTKVEVVDRVVLISGTVKKDEQKTEAEQIAVTEPGIKKVVSYLRVKPEGDGGY